MKYYLFVCYAAAIATYFTFGAATHRRAGESVAELSRAFLSEKFRPRIEIAGRYESFSAVETESLEPRSSTEFRGTVDLATRQFRYEFKGFRRPISGGAEPFDISDITAVFDGEKWVLIRTPKNRSGEHVAVAGLWFPKVAEFQQIQGTKVTVKRRYILDEVKLEGTSEPLLAVVPQDCMVIDNRSGISYSTSDTSPKPKENVKWLTAVARLRA